MSVDANHSTGLEGLKAIAAVRWILLMGTAAVVLGSGPGAETEDWIRSGALVAVMTLFVAALSRVPTMLERVDAGERLKAALMQGLDIVAVLGVLYLLHDFMPDSSWAVLAIPIVLSSVRVSALGVLCVWLTSCSLYGFMASSLPTAPGDDVIAASVFVERAGILLAIAACLALLTRWLQSGWIEQAQQASETDQRLSNAKTIENAGREMRGRPTNEVMAVTLRHAFELGFEAVTLSGPGMPMQVIGDGAMVPADEMADAPPSGIVELTAWDGPGDDLFSVASYEHMSQALICGWSSQPPGRLQAEALGDLVAQSSMAVEIAELFSAARYEADHDPLTGLFNRASFERNAQTVAARRQPVALMYLDLDYFKQINDTLGHDTGDQVLQAVARILERHVTGESMIARFGGDEFVAMLVGPVSLEAKTCADRIHLDVREWAAQEDLGGVALGVSIGIAQAQDEYDLDALRRTADEALYSVKESGRGGTSIVDMSVAVEHRRTQSSASPEAVALPPAALSPLPLHIPPLPAVPLAPPTIDWEHTPVSPPTDPGLDGSRADLALTGGGEGGS
jgi:diguanylate cyclase (GGDEF)-like protein